jgi:hypothetical protein
MRPSSRCSGRSGHPAERHLLGIHAARRSSARGSPVSQDNAAPAGRRGAVERAEDDVETDLRRSGMRRSGFGVGPSIVPHLGTMRLTYEASRRHDERDRRPVRSRSRMRERRPPLRPGSKPDGLAGEVAIVAVTPETIAMAGDATLPEPPPQRRATPGMRSPENSSPTACNRETTRGLHKRAKHSVPSPDACSNGRQR